MPRAGILLAPTRSLGATHRMLLIGAFYSRPSTPAQKKNHLQKNEDDLSYCRLDKCRGRGSNPHSGLGNRILSPARLPVPPPRLVAVRYMLFIKIQLRIFLASISQLLLLRKNSTICFCINFFV